VTSTSFSTTWGVDGAAGVAGWQAATTRPAAPVAEIAKNSRRLNFFDISSSWFV
jgi:hypothetical protein